VRRLEPLNGPAKAPLSGALQRAAQGANVSPMNNPRAAIKRR
jgi:hypothetical protein